MSLARISVDLGKNPSWLRQTKRNHPDQYNYMIELGGGNIEKGAKKYLTKLREITFNIDNMYSDIKSKTTLVEFYKANSKEIPYKNYATLCAILNRVVYKTEKNNDMSFKAYLNLLKLLTVFYKWKIGRED